jgi:hypothetical protein
MKWHLVFLLFCVSITGKAQSSSAVPPVRGYIFYGSPTRYASLDDTVTTRSTTTRPIIPPGGHAFLVKRLNRHWFSMSFNPTGTPPYFYLSNTAFYESSPYHPRPTNSSWH